MWIRNLFLTVYGLSAGALTAAGFLAFLSMIGIIPRLAAMTKSIKYARLYEDFIALGGIAGTAVFLYRIKIPLGYPMLLIFGLFGGIFIGCLIGAPGGSLKKSSDFFQEDCPAKRNRQCDLCLGAGQDVRMLSSILFILTKEGRHEKGTK